MVNLGWYIVQGAKVYKLKSIPLSEDFSKQCRQLVGFVTWVFPLCQSTSCLWNYIVQGVKVSKGAKIRNQYNQVPHLTQDTNGKVTNSQLDTTNESQEASPFSAGDHKAQINRRAQRHSKHKTEQKHKRSTKEVPPWNGQ